MENPIPIDLIIEIVSRLPAESVARCRCVSKLWRTILRRQDFTELFLTKSKARPRLLMGVKQGDEWSFYSMPQPQNHYRKSSSLVVSAAVDFHTNFSKGRSGLSISYASGLIYIHKMCIPKDGEDEKRLICNPLTGRYVILPEMRGNSYSYLGFDPVDKEFKVLFMRNFTCIADIGTDHHILTLGSGELRWRKIQCPFYHEPFWERICINGVLYYTALRSDYSDGRSSHVIVCFDVRSEKFKFISGECSFDQLINYKGKLCGVSVEYTFGVGFPLTFSMCVLEDVEKQEWLKFVYSLPAEGEVAEEWLRYVYSSGDGSTCYPFVYGMTATGDIVFAMNYASTPFYVFYFNPERNTLQMVKIQGVGEENHDCRLDAFVDYVEDLSVNDATQLTMT
ncbi:putative F-box protein At1g30930 [Capsella rubella]|uniref:putative F-box protein At1g30930 n=1 Tax=Capsella rubella TaxID=81985 RepID=UPI000CD589D6|nr:putative F-box protein At1g30930 [Capsella rubella]